MVGYTKIREKKELERICTCFWMYVSSATIVHPCLSIINLYYSVFTLVQISYYGLIASHPLQISCDDQVLI